MNKSILKKVMVLMLAFTMAFVNVPLSAFATEGETVAKDRKIGSLYVKHYDVSGLNAYNDNPYDSTDVGTKGDSAHKEQWTSLVPTVELDSVKIIKPATQTNNNWDLNDTASVFLNDLKKSDNGSGAEVTEKTAYQAKGYITVDEGTRIRAQSDDGIYLNIGTTSAVEDWDLQTDGEVTTAALSAGIHEFFLSYMNWGGDGKLILEMSIDGAEWTPVTSDMFYIEDDMPSLDEFKINGVPAIINQDTGEVTLTLPAGTDVSQLSPVTGETGVLSPTGLQDFSSSVTYKVTNSFDTEKEYVVTVMVEQPLMINANNITVEASELGHDIYDQVTVTARGVDLSNDDAGLSHNNMGNKLLSPGLLNVSKPGVYTIEYTATYEGETVTVSRTITVLPITMNSGLEVGFGIVNPTTSNSKWTSFNLERYSELVLLAQMQTAKNSTPANLRNNILYEKHGMSNLVSGDYWTTIGSFKSFVEMADDSSASANETLAYLATESGFIRDINGDIIGEAGITILDLNESQGFNKKWNTVTLNKEYDNPVVIAQLTSFTGPNTTHVRLRDVESDSFDVYFEEWAKYISPLHHNLELVSYVVIEEGAYKLNDRTTLIANLEDDTENYYNDFNEYMYGVNFIGLPKVFSQTQTHENKKQTWIRHKDLGSSSVQMKLQQEITSVLPADEFAVIAIGQTNLNAPALSILDAADDSILKNWSAKIGFGQPDVVEKKVKVNIPQTLIRTLKWSLNDSESGTTEVTLDTTEEPITLTANAETETDGQTLKVDIVLIDGTKLSETMIVDVEEVIEPQLAILDATTGIEVSNWITTIGYMQPTVVSKQFVTNIPDSEIQSISWTVDDKDLTEEEVKFTEMGNAALLTALKATSGTDVIVEVTMIAGHTLSKTFNVIVTEINDRDVVIVDSTDENATILQSITLNLANTDTKEVFRKIITDGSVAHVANWTLPIENDFIEATEDESGESVELKGLKVTNDPVQISVLVTYEDGNTSSVTLDVNVIDDAKPIVLLTPEGTFTSSKSITINSDATDVVAYYYTTDGSQPSVTDSSYTGTSITKSLTTASFNVSKTTTVKAIAVDAISQISDVASVTYTKYVAPVVQQPSTGGRTTNTVTALASISLNTDKVELEVGIDADPTLTEFDLKETIRNSSSRAVTWSVADPEIASVDQNGVVKALKQGETTVRVKHTASGASAKAIVSVFLVDDGTVVLGAVEFFDPYIFGYPDSTFRPKNSVTRAEVATMFAKILNLNIMYPGTQKYDDVTEGTWYYNYVQASSRAGLFLDDNTNNFRPNDAITRAELATVFSMFWEFEEIKADASKVKIDDIDDNYWAAEDIYKIYNAGIVAGYEDGTFRPDSPTLREHVVGMINTLIARPEFDAVQSKFTDIDGAHWAYGNIEAASQVFVKENNIPVQE